MEELRFSIDEEKYDDRRGQVLSLSGWYAAPGNRKFSFCLLGDGKERISLPEPEHFARPDVEKALNTQFGDFLPGFALHISCAEKLAERFQTLELFLTAEDEKISVWKKDRKELQDFLRQSLLEYHIDRAEVLYDTMVEIQGWAVDQRGYAQIEFHRGDGSLLPCRMTRGRRPDVVERRNLDDGYKEQEIGFRISTTVEETGGKKAVLKFLGSFGEQTYEIDIQELRKEKKKKGLSGRFRKGGAEDGQDYEEWRKRRLPGFSTLWKEKRTVFPSMPLVSIVIPLYCTPLPYLKELIDSVRKQTYRNWQLCLADGSPDEKIREYLHRNYGREKRISYMKLKRNGGISANTNAAVSLARGEFLMLCDHDDTLEPDALFEIVKALNENPRADVVYTDEDKVSMDGQHYFDPHFKPDFNLFRLRENNYICHIFAVRKTVAEKAGLFRPEFDGAQDYDFIFRCCEEAEEIVHIPKVLYHWRCHMESTAADPASKMYAYEAGKRAVEEHYQRCHIAAEVEMTERPGWYRSRVEIKRRPLISIIIPNKDHIGDLELCLSSLTERSTWDNYEVLVVENNSEREDTFAYYEKIPERYPGVRVIVWEKEFNYSAINNFAAEQAAGEYLLFLNNDVEILTPQWMEEMLMICQQDQVAVTGAKLYYPDDTIQHAGVVLGLGGIAGHIMCRASGEDAGYFGRMISVQEISAVTAACMLVKKSDFQAVGGFDESFRVAFNDIDLCMKMRAENKKVVFTPHAELYHYESKSRGLEDTPEKQFRFDKEVRRFQEKWGKELEKGDPFYNPNLSVTEGDCSLRAGTDR